MKQLEFIKNEKDYYGKIFIDINYAINNVSPFISSSELAKRKYESRLPVLKRYIELLESAEREAEKEGLFSFSGGKYRDLLESYKSDHRKDLMQLEKCSKCRCLNCTSQCRYDGCIGCREGANVVSCDHKKINVVFHDSFTLDLINERTGRNERYRVLATLQDVELDRRYIIIEGIYSKEKYILYYYPGISEDTYGEIKDENEFDFIISVYESIER